MLSTTLCTFCAVPFSMTDHEGRPVLALTPRLFPSVADVADIVDVDDLAAAIIRFCSFSPMAGQRASAVDDGTPRRQRSRHNAGSGAAEDETLAPLPDIITSSNSSQLISQSPASPAPMSPDSGFIDAPRDVFSFDEERVAEFRDRQASPPSSLPRAEIQPQEQEQAWALAPPPPPRRARRPSSDNDEGLGEEDSGNDGDDEAEDSAEEAAAKENKDGYEAAAVEIVPDDNKNAVEGRWKKVGRELRQIADDFHFMRTGESHVQPWTVNFGEFFRLLLGFLWSRLINRWFGF